MIETAELFGLVMCHIATLLRVPVGIVLVVVFVLTVWERANGRRLTNTLREIKDAVTGTDPAPVEEE